MPNDNVSFAKLKRLPNSERKCIHPLLEQLRRRRLAVNISQEKLSIDLGYGVNQVSKVESGKTKPSFQFVEDYASAMGLMIKLEEK